MEKVLQKLKKLGLSDYEAKVYVTLLQKDRLTAIEISRVTKIPKTKIYAVINNLEKKNFCIRVAGKEKCYKANDPQRPISNQLSKMQQQMEDLEVISDFLSQQYHKYKGNDDEIDYIEVIKDADMILKRSEQIENQTNNTIKCMLKAPFIMDSEAILKNYTSPTIKNIKYTYLYEEKVFEDELLMQVLKKFQNHGIEIRICNRIPLKAAIFDDKTVMISLKDKISTQTSFTAMFVHHEDVSVAFSEIFSFYYNKSISLDEKVKELMGG